MSHDVQLTNAARRDLLRLADFLAHKSRRAALGATEAIISALDSLREFPERASPAPSAEHRVLPVKFGRDGYVILFRVRGEAVVVARIFHSREAC